MRRREEWESASLSWIHGIREAHYRETRRLPLGTWLKPVDPDKAASACRRMELKVRLPEEPGQRRGKPVTLRSRRAARAAGPRRRRQGAHLAAAGVDETEASGSGAPLALTSIVGRQAGA